jgi:hypothetical protein
MFRYFGVLDYFVTADVYLISLVLTVNVSDKG